MNAVETGTSRDCTTWPPVESAARAMSPFFPRLRGLLTVCSGLMISTLLDSPLLAQESTTTTTVVTSGRSFLIDGAIVVVLCGLAVFAVCRASRRS